MNRLDLLTHPLTTDGFGQYFCPPESLEAMTKAISSMIGGESIISSENIYRVKDVPDPAEDDLGETVIELREALLEDADCIRVWSEWYPKSATRLFLPSISSYH